MQSLDNLDGVVVVLSGGLDSTILTHVLVNKIGAEKVFALSFNYGQKQSEELRLASATCKLLGVQHSIIDISFLGDIVSPVCANIEGTCVKMPTIADVLGDPQPPTYVPYRNMILNSIAFSYAEVNNCEWIATGLQVHDTYGYWDTSSQFVEAMNSVSACNRKHQIKMLAPFADMSKLDELRLLEELDIDINDVAINTLTCYNPSVSGFSCGDCPSCAERIAAFGMLGKPDPIAYSKNLNWDKICAQYSEVST